jgi:predicted GTPase
MCCHALPKKTAALEIFKILKISSDLQVVLMVNKIEKRKMIHFLAL